MPIRIQRVEYGIRGGHPGQLYNYTLDIIAALSIAQLSRPSMNLHQEYTSDRA